MRVLTLLCFVVLSGCATARPEPEIRIVEKVVPVSVSCVPQGLPKPDYTVAVADIIAAPDAASRYALTAAALAERIARLDVVEPVLAGCQ